LPRREQVPAARVPISPQSGNPKTFFSASPTASIEPGV
jgi:hypothetical protein